MSDIWLSPVIGMLYLMLGPIYFILLQCLASFNFSSCNSSSDFFYLVGELEGQIKPFLVEDEMGA